MSYSSAPNRNAPPMPQQQQQQQQQQFYGLTRSTSPGTGGGAIGFSGINGTTPASGSALGLTPDHGSGYAAGINSLMVKENVDSALDAHGLSANAVQVGILKAKVQGIQSELTRTRQDLKEANEKLAQTSAKLNAEKIQNSSLLHKQNALMSKLSDAETNERELEEALIAEKKAHNLTREGLERTRNAHDDVSALLSSTKEALARLQQQTATAGDGERCRDRTLYIPTAEHLDMQERFRKAHEQLMEHVKGSFERIAQSQEEDETSLFIARSAVLSSATDLETKICHAENMLELLKGTMERFTREFEEDAGRMLLSLMTENKELWATVSKQQFELDRASSELAARGRRDDYVHRDQVEYLNKAMAGLEERLRRSQDTIEAQTEAAKVHAERMREVLDENAALRRHLAECEQDLQNTRDALAAKEREAEELSSQIKSLQLQVQELTKANQILQAQIGTISTELRNARETLENETRSTIRQLQTERNDAVDASNRLRGELEDAQQRIAVLERDLDARAAAFAAAKTEWEVQHNNVVHALQDELSNTRAIFEGELEELRRDLSMKDDDLRRQQRDLDALRLDQQNNSGAARAIEEARAQLERELGSVKAALQRAEDRIRKLTTESDSFRNSSITYEGRVQTLTAENARLSAQVSQLEASLAEERSRLTAQSDHLEREWAESERTRTTLIEEITKLRAKASEDSQLKALKERMEKEKEMLMAENVRLHQTYQDVQQQNVQLQQQLSQLKGKLSGIGQLSQQLEDVQRRMAELPVLRQQAEDARRDALRAREETEALRQERDEMSQRLEFFLEEARVNAKKDTDLDRLFREASNQVRRLDQQIDEVTQRQPAGEAILPSASASAAPSPYRGAQYNTNNNASTASSIYPSGGAGVGTRGVSTSSYVVSNNNNNKFSSSSPPQPPSSAAVLAGLSSGGYQSTSASSNRVVSTTTTTRVEDIIMASGGASSSAVGNASVMSGGGAPRVSGGSPSRQPWH